MHHGSVQHHQLSAKTSSLKHRSWPQGAALDRNAIGPKWRSANVAGRSMTRWFALTGPLRPPWYMSFKSAILNIWSRLWFWNGWPEFQTPLPKNQKAINMPKYPFCKATCDTSAHQCLSGESFLWSSSQPMVFLSIQSLEPLQSFFWDRWAEFIVWSAPAEAQNTWKYHLSKLLHQWSVVASWEPAKKQGDFWKD